MGPTGKLQDDADRIRWLAREILPHEADVRGWLRRSLVISGEIDDVVQEAYCRLADVKDFERIISPRAYFFQTARSIVLEQMRRARIVRIEAVTEIDALCIEWDEPSPERIAGARRELARVMEIVATLPERARRIFEMRKILGLSRRKSQNASGSRKTSSRTRLREGLKPCWPGWKPAPVRWTWARPGVVAHDRLRNRPRHPGPSRRLGRQARRRRLGA